MKRVAVVVSVLAVLVTCSLAAVSSAAPARTHSRLVIGIALPGINAFVASEQKEYMSLAKKEGVTLDIQQADFDTAKQQQAVTTFIAQKVNGIVLWPIDPNSAVPLVNQATAAGIPVVSVNNPVGSQAGVYPKLVGVVGQADLKNGQLMTAYDIAGAAKEFPGKTINMFAIEGQLGSAPQRYRHQGMENALKKVKTKVKLIGTTAVNDWTEQGALTAMTDELQRTKDIQVIYTHSFAFAQGAVQALKNAGLDPSKVWISGFDYDKASRALFAKGCDIHATLRYDQRQEGRQGLLMLLAHLRKQSTKMRQLVHPPSQIITCQNYKKWAPTF